MIGDLNVTIPDTIEPVKAYRVWTVRSDADGTVTLFSTNGTPWVPGEELEAKCERKRLVASRVPEVDVANIGSLMLTTEYHSHAQVADPCGETPSEEKHGFTAGCGIYGWLDTAELVGGQPDFRHHIVGEIELSGTVLVHDTGYRASYAQIVALYDTHPKAGAAAERYDVPLVQFDPDAAMDLFIERQWARIVPLAEPTLDFCKPARFARHLLDTWRNRGHR